MHHERLRLVRITPENESLLYNYINDNFADVFFFHVNYAQYSEDTKIFMALDDQNKIQGMILIWKSRRLQLRGSIESLEFLLKSKSYTPISIMGFYNHRELIVRFFPEYKNEIALYRMSLKKGDQNDFEKIPYEILKESHREEIVSFMRNADPIFWGSHDLEDILIDEHNKWFGIFDNANIRTSFLGYLYKRKGMILNNMDEGDAIEELTRFVEENID
ncbi:MAG: hypothetical protein ACFFKA_13905, partial [Candidatus Thorarchaeota archaeon]